MRGEPADARLDKLEALLLPLGATPDEVALIAEMLGVPGGERYPPLALSPERKKEQTFGALNRILDERARRSPVLMLFEDAHWADPSSLELLDRLIMRSGLAAGAGDHLLPARVPGALGRPGRRDLDCAEPSQPAPGSERSHPRWSSARRCRPGCWSGLWRRPTVCLCSSRS